MIYNVYEQMQPVKSERKGRDNRNEWEADIRFVNTLDVPSDKDPIEFARIRYGIDHPLVSAYHGYNDDGKVLIPNLQ
jgi:hypothetical protein